MTFIAPWDSKLVEILKVGIFYNLKVLYTFLLFFEVSRIVNTILSQNFNFKRKQRCLNVYQFSIQEIKGNNV